MLIRKIIWLLLSFLLLSAIWLQAAIPAQERNALIDLYNSTNGANWAYQTGWLGAAGTECSWALVACDESQTSVLALELSRNQLNGSIPSSLGSFINLRTLTFGNNQLTGSIPPELVLKPV